MRELRGNAMFLLLPALAAAVFFAGCLQQSGSAYPDLAPPGAKVVEMTAEGFSPKEISVKEGETVAFVNKDAAPHWPASAMHPTHLVYPGSGISKCGTPEQSGIFDACGQVPSGKVYAFTFSETGEWAYHDHLNCCTDARFFGKVKVG